MTFGGLSLSLSLSLSLCVLTESKWDYLWICFSPLAFEFRFCTFVYSFRFHKKQCRKSAGKKATTCHRNFMKFNFVWISRNLRQIILIRCAWHEYQSSYENHTQRGIHVRNWQFTNLKIVLWGTKTWTKQQEKKKKMLPLLPLSQYTHSSNWKC